MPPDSAEFPELPSISTTTSIAAPPHSDSPAPSLSLLSPAPPTAAATSASTSHGSAHLHELIAHYLAVNYPGALPSFLYASGTPAPDTAHPPVPDLETLVEDARAADAARRLAALQLTSSAADADQPSLTQLVSRALPPSETLTGVQRTVEVSAANLLAVAVADVPSRRFDTATAAYVAERRRAVLVASADKSVRVLDYASGAVLEVVEPHKAPALALAVHPTNPRYLASGGMDGTAALTDLVSGATVQVLPSAKFVVRVAFSADGRWLAAASYDHSVSVYEAEGSAHAPPVAEDEGEDEDGVLPLDETDDADLAMDPSLRYTLRHRVATDANPEALLFHPHATWLMYTVRGSHEMHYLGLPPAGDDDQQQGTATPWGWPTRAKSFNAHPLDAHVSFAVLDLALDPTGRVVAGITGDHASGGERVLLYGVEPDETDRLACLWTHTASDDFVLPRVRWTPDGRGLVVGSPTGHIVLLSPAGEVRARVKVHAARVGVPGTSDVVRDLQVVPLGDGEGSVDGEGEGAAGEAFEVVSVGYDRCVHFTR